MCDKMFEQIRAKNKKKKKEKKKKIVTKLERNEWSRTLKLIDWSFERIFRRASHQDTLNLWYFKYCLSPIIIINTYPPKIYILLSLTHVHYIFIIICVQVPRVSTAFSITWIWYIYIIRCLIRFSIDRKGISCICFVLFFFFFL